MTKAQLLILVALLCVAAIVTGIYLLTGLPWALMAAGVFGLVGVVLLFDPVEKRP